MRKKKRRYNDGVYLRTSTWWLDCRISGSRYQMPLGASELAQVKRAAILRGEVGIGKKKKDLTFDKAAELFLEWAKANKRPNTAAGYGVSVKRLNEFFGSRRLSEISPQRVG